MERITEKWDKEFEGGEVEETHLIILTVHLYARERGEKRKA